MAQITLRNVDQELHQFLQQQARDKGISLNQYIVRLLKAVWDQNENKYRKEIYHDLDSLSGTWNNEMFAEFSLHLHKQRQIDEATRL